MDLLNQPNDIFATIINFLERSYIGKLFCVSKSICSKVKEIIRSIRKLHSRQITDAGLKVFQGILAIDLISAKKITNSSMIYLSNIQTINLGCTNITDEGLVHFRGVQSIGLQYTKIINAELTYLGGAHSIDLSGTQITDDGLSCLKQVHRIDLSFTEVIGSGLIYLQRGQF